MASLDEVLSSMEDMGGEEDDALDFLIDENLRVISVPEQGVVLGVEGDKDVNRVRFRMNRYYHQADLSTFDIRINYQNAEGDKNYFEVSEKTATDDSLSFVWTVAADAVSYKGQVCFIVVCLKASAEGTIDKAYHTTIGKASVLEGFTVDEQVDQPKVQDLMLHLKNDLTTHAKGLMENAKKEAKAAAEEASAAAESSAKAAKESEAQSATSEANALKSAQGAAGSVTAASALAQAAKTSETNADSSAKAAKTSETNAKKYSERAQALSDGYKGWYQTEKELATDLSEAKNGDWAIVGESDTIWVWDGDASKWKCSAPSGVLNTVTITVPAKEPTENSVMWVRLGRLENTSDMDSILLEIGGGVKIASEVPREDGYSKGNAVISLGTFSMAITDMPQNDATDLSSAYAVWEKGESGGDQRDVPFVGVEDITQTTAFAEETPESNGATASGSDSTGSISFGDIGNPEFFVLATKGGDGTSCADVWVRLPYTMYDSYTSNDVSYHSKISYGFNLECRWSGRAGLFSYDGTQTLAKPANGTNQKERYTLNLVSTDYLGDGLAGDYNTAIHVTPATKDTIGGIKLSEDFTADADGMLHLAGGNCPFEVGDFIHTTSSVSPAARWGGTWEEVASERVLMGASSTHAAGTTVEAGLPNITGSFPGASYNWEVGSTGAFTQTGGKESGDNYKAWFKFQNVSFDASRSSPVYGRSNTVQPAAYYVHIWHRVA